MRFQRLSVVSTRLLAALLLAGLLTVLLTTCGPGAQPTPTSQGRATDVRPTPTPRPLPLPFVPSTPTAAPLPSALGGSAVEADLLREAALPVPTQRIIVRTVALTLVVNDVRKALVQIADVATQFGGWVVSSSQTGPQTGTITIRVPAELLDSSLGQLRSTAIKVKSEVSKSEDFTDEYVDSAARVKNLQATEATLIEFLKKAEKVDDALKVQTELAKVQGDIEKLQGRLGFLEQSVAYSLVQVELTRSPIAVSVNAGNDIKAKEAEPLSFRATFNTLEGISDFVYTWDFGDGSSPILGTRTAPVVDSSQRVTATVSHVYSSRSGSPYIVTVHIAGTGEAGIIEGDDTVIVQVLEDPKIEVYAGEDMRVTEGQSVELVGTFTRPHSLNDFSYRWDFGDGSEPVTGSLDEAVSENQMAVKHTYAHHRPQPFSVTLRVTATGDVGEVVSQDQMAVSVNRRTPVFLGWDVNNTVRSAVLILTSIGTVIGSIAIFAVVLSPVWGTAALVAWYVRRATRRRMSRAAAKAPAQPPETPRDPASRT